MKQTRNIYVFLIATRIAQMPANLAQPHERWLKKKKESQLYRSAREQRYRPGIYTCASKIRSFLVSILGAKVFLDGMRAVQDAQCLHATKWKRVHRGNHEEVGKTPK